MEKNFEVENRSGSGNYNLHKRYLFMPSGLSVNKDIALILREQSGFEPSLWLGDPLLNQFAAGQFPGSLVLDLDEIRFGKAAKHPVLTATWEGAIEYWESDIFQKNRPALLDEFARYADGHFALHMDREIILRNIHLQLLDSLLRVKPRFMLASETPHNPVFLSMFFLLRWLDVPCLFFQPTTSVAPALLPRTWIDETFPLSRAKDEFQNDSPPYVKDFAEKAIDSFKSGGGSLRQRWQTAQNEALTAKTGPRLKKSAFVYTHLVGRALRRASLRRTKDPFNHFLALRKKKLVSEFSTLPREQNKREGPTALFAMHYQPERTSVPEGGSESNFQVQLVMRARALLPMEITLLVKEHPSQLMASKNGHLGRSPLFYSFLQQLPNTVLMDERGELKDVTRSSEAVFTITGTIGIEAALWGVPAIHFGHPWWSGLPGTTPFDSSLSFSQHVELASADPSKAEAELLHLLASRVIPGVGTPSQETFWNQQEGFPDSFQEDALDSIVKITNDFWLEKVFTETV